MRNSKRYASKSRSLLIAAAALSMLAGCAKDQPPQIIVKHVYPPAVPDELLQRPFPAKCFAPAKGQVPVEVLERDRNCIHKDRETLIARSNALIDAVEARQQRSGAHE